MGRHSEHGRYKPDDPIFREGFQVYTPYQVRQRPPAPVKEETEEDQEPEDG